MIRLGFITEHPTKSKKRIFGKITEECFLSSKNPFELVTVTLPFSASRLERLKEKHRLKVLDKAKGIMNEKGVKHCFFSPEIKRISNISSDEEFCLNKKNIFDKWVYRCVVETSRKCGIHLLNSKVCISDNKAERISENLLRALCYDTKFLSLSTLNFSKAKAVCEDIFEDTGMLVKIEKLNSPKFSDVLIDVDNAFVRIGRNLIIDGVSIDLELAGFTLNPVEVTAAIGDEGLVNENLSYFFGKKKLTL